MIGYFAIGLLVIFNTLAQILEKKGIMNIHEPLKVDWATAQRIITNPLIVGGVLCAVASLILWLYILSRFNISYAQPLTALVYVLVALAAYWYFGEPISTVRAIGIGVIVLGCVLVNL